MRIHSNILTSAKLAHCVIDSNITPDIEFIVFSVHGSRKRSQAWEIQLGTFNQFGGPTRSRHFKNTGTRGVHSIWAATYDEWGWFLANVFTIDPEAIAGSYDGVDDFNEKTGNNYWRQVAV